MDPEAIHLHPPDPYSALGAPLVVLDSGPESSGLKALDHANTGFIGECRDRRPAAVFTSTSRASFDRLMDTTPHDFVTVDMRGLKAALVTRARADRVSVSVLVRRAVEHELGAEGVGAAGGAGEGADECHQDSWVKLSIRMRRDEAQRLAAGARAAELSRGAYLAGLVDGTPVLMSGGSRPECIAALTASCAELSTFSRNVHQLTALLRDGNVKQALEYRGMLDALTGDIRTHLALAAQALSALRGQRLAPRGRSAPPARSGRST